MGFAPRIEKYGAETCKSKLIGFRSRSESARITLGEYVYAERCRGFVVFFLYVKEREKERVM